MALQKDEEERTVARFKRNLPDKKRKEIFIGCETLGGGKILF